MHPRVEIHILDVAEFATVQIPNVKMLKAPPAIDHGARRQTMDHVVDQTESCPEMNDGELYLCN